VTLAVTAIAVRGRWFKHTYPGSSPLPERDPPPDNRWQRGDVVDALYLADSEETAWAEWYRHLAERAIPPLAQMPREMWTWQVDVEVADLSTDEKLAAVGLPRPSPVAALGPHTKMSVSDSQQRAGQDCLHPAPPDCRAASFACFAARLVSPAPKCSLQRFASLNRPHLR
jgi:hypothetical protein